MKQQPIIQIFLSAIEQAILSSTINGVSDSFFWNQTSDSFFCWDWASGAFFCKWASDWLFLLQSSKVVLSFGNSSKWWCLLFLLCKRCSHSWNLLLSGIEILISLSEPSVEVCLLTKSGLSEREVLTSTTVPEIGEYTSLTAFTLSTLANFSPCLHGEPASGSSTNTKSPNSFCNNTSINTFSLLRKGGREGKQAGRQTGRSPTKDAMEFENWELGVPQMALEKIGEANLSMITDAHNGSGTFHFHPFMRCRIMQPIQNLCNECPNAHIVRKTATAQIPPNPNAQNCKIPQHPKCSKSQKRKQRPDKNHMSKKNKRTHETVSPSASSTSVANLRARGTHKLRRVLVVVVVLVMLLLLLLTVGIPRNRNKVTAWVATDLNAISHSPLLPQYYSLSLSLLLLPPLLPKPKTKTKKIAQRQKENRG